MKKTIALILTTAVLGSTAAHAAPVYKAKTATVKKAQSVAERNKANALAFYEMAFNQHRVQEAADRYIGKTYLQHNPGVTDGAQAFVDAFVPFLKENPQSRAEIKRVMADGDLVMLHVLSRTSPQDKGEAVVDIFRFDKAGKIVEHWDVIQAVPDKTASGRSMF